MKKKDYFQSVPHGNNKNGTSDTKIACDMYVNIHVSWLELESFMKVHYKKKKQSLFSDREIF